VSNEFDNVPTMRLVWVNSDGRLQNKASFMSLDARFLETSRGKYIDGTLRFCMLLTKLSMTTHSMLYIEWVCVLEWSESVKY
jgi:hypothetical protein